MLWAAHWALRPLVQFRGRERKTGGWGVGGLLHVAVEGAGPRAMRRRDKRRALDSEMFQKYQHAGGCLVQGFRQLSEAESGAGKEPNEEIKWRRR